MSHIAISEARKRVLDMAEQLFQQHGYRGITMRDIAKEIGIRQASLYYHFPDGKEQMYMEVTERRFERHRTGLETALQQAVPDLKSKLLAAADWFWSQPPVHLISMMHIDMPVLSPANVERVKVQAYQAMMLPIRHIFAEAQQRREIRDVNVDMLTGAFMALIDGFAQANESRITDSSPQTMMHEMINVILYGLEPGMNKNLKEEKAYASW